MHRLRTTLFWDIQLQLRNGFYAAAAFVLFSWAALLSFVPGDGLRWALPPLILGNLVLGSFYFVGGLVLLERAEGSLMARTVTPLRTGEYLSAKVASLVLLCLVESVLLTLLFVGPGFAIVPFVAGVLLGGAVLTLAGFSTVVRFASINEYLMPSILVTAVLTLPLIAYVGGWNHWLLYLHPFTPALVLVEAAFAPATTWRIGSGLVGGGLWTVFAGWYAQRDFRRYVRGDGQGERGLE
jgi:fluoroquinolone transport system permease protein